MALELCPALESISFLTMNSGAILRVARPSDHLADVAEMYGKGLGFIVLAQFENHDGFDGIVLGHPLAPYHLEFTAERGKRAVSRPLDDHLLVFYIPGSGDWERTCVDMIAAGFNLVRSHNPYWDLRGKTFEDLDGVRVVLQNAEWAP
jgi:hypothetical protein